MTPSDPQPDPAAPTLAARKAALLEAVEKMTPGPWEISTYPRGGYKFIGPITGEAYSEIRADEEDANGILALRNDAPALLDDYAAELQESDRMLQYWRALFENADERAEKLEAENAALRVPSAETMGRIMGAAERVLDANGHHLLSFERDELETALAEVVPEPLLTARHGEMLREMFEPEHGAVWLQYCGPDRGWRAAASRICPEDGATPAAAIEAAHAEFVKAKGAAHADPGE
jgi:hypothetical protein